MVNTQWAALERDLGVVDTTTSGLKLITPSPFVVIPANTWFVVGGVCQIAVCQPYVGNASQKFTPAGQSNVGSGVNSTEGWHYQSGVTGALGNLIPNNIGLINIGHAVGFRRST